ncbi:aminodeoxychorismate synthase component I [Thiomicrorhabdus sp.]|uniref:aminodeoxychorismate synthase component I n=1 Tax=Thiomicrorhabdus sp. TaxID=2039724 RepID=UPI002AA5FC5D|nr:aminodeoxychorismate synthase component I [Thiomicrorhabdus sp.]
MTFSANSQASTSLGSQSPIINKILLSDLPGLVNLKTPSIDLSLLHQLNPSRYPFLLESVAKGGLGEFDILMAYPQETIQLTNPADAENFINQAQAQFSQINPDIQNRENLPFIGGWFAYFSYDYAQVVEPVLQLPKSQFPLANLTRIPAGLVFEHSSQNLYLVAEPEFEHCLAEIESDLINALALNNDVLAVKVNSDHEEPEQKYLSGVEAIKEYILAGDVFQVNLSRQWQVELEKNTSYLDVYRALRKSNPAPFAALAHFETGSQQSNLDNQAWQIISSSPERLVKYQKPWVETRPIAGTRKRGENAQADKALVTELIEHPKERAEHIMLIDLERNDLGRICQPGTVEVNELMVVETYEHVHHIVSNVRGQLQEGLSPLDIVHALFPGGTITGCPKIRCMQIVAELEQMPREAYTGSLGYINIDGSLDLNILIRTMIQFEQNGNPIVQFRAGAGIVADSEAQSELTETRHKAKGLVKALETPIETVGSC